MSKQERQKRYREALKQRMESDPLFAAEFKRKASVRQERWRQANPEKVRAANSYAANRAVIVASRKRNADTRRSHDATRRARKRVAGGTYTAADVRALKVAQKGCCVMCKQAFGSAYQVDHVMPLALGGANDRSNLQLLCRPCNQSKGAKHPVDFAQERGLLL